MSWQDHKHQPIVDPDPRVYLRTEEIRAVALG